MNENWNRWLAASLAQYFKSKKGDLETFNVPGFVRVLDPTIERAELNSSGPEWEEVTKNQYLCDVSISVLVTTTLAKGYRIHELTGRFAKAAEGPIDVKKLGNRVGDDASVVGCLVLKGKVEVHDWGQLDNDVMVTQSSVEGTYHMELTGDNT